MAKKLTKKQIDKRVEAAYYRTCNRITINMMDIPKVFDVGRKALENGADEEQLGETLRLYVEMIRVV